MTDIIGSKASIRAEIKRRREAVSEDELISGDKRLTAKFREALASDGKLGEVFDKASFIAVYKAMGGELPCDDLASYIRSLGKKTLYPKVFGKDMLFFEVSDPATELKPGRFGILEPEGSPILACDKIPDIVIVPGMAFDRDLNRLGRGGGYYDRWLGSFKTDNRPVLIGVCFGFQLVEQVPSDTFDIPADVLLCI